MEEKEENPVTADQWADRIIKIGQLETQYILEARELDSKLKGLRTEHGNLRIKGNLIEIDDPEIPEKLLNLETQIKEKENQILNLEAAQKGLQTQKLEANKIFHEMRVRESIKNYKSTESVVEQTINEIVKSLVTNDIKRKWEEILELHRTGDRICQEYQKSAGFLGIPKKGCPPRMPRLFRLGNLGEFLGDIGGKIMKLKV